MAIRVTDHAVIRYLERHYGFDFEKMRAQLDTPTVRLAAKMKARSVKFNGGRLIIENDTVITYLPSKAERKRHTQGVSNAL